LYFGIKVNPDQTYGCWWVFRPGMAQEGGDGQVTIDAAEAEKKKIRIVKNYIIAWDGGWVNGSDEAQTKPTRIR
jgi:hypothetical protein